MLNDNSKSKFRDIHDCKILIIDDANLNRELIHSYLEHAGFRNIEMAVDGVEGFEKTSSFKPELVIVDLIMPRMDGYEFIEKVRRKEESALTPIIVQTSITEPEQRAEAWKVGASDVLSKPIHRLELLSRVKVQLNNLALIKELESYQMSARQDIQQALDVQKTLLPTGVQIEELEKKHNIKIDYLFSPSRFLSGDLWGLIDVSDNALGVWICDFAGKGIRAALNTFRIHTLMQEYRYCSDEPCEIIDAINQKLVSLIPAGQFATFLYGILDFKESVFLYTAASSTHPLIYKPKEKKFSLGDGTGAPLGITKDQVYPLRTLEIKNDQSLILYSDLLWEPNALPGINFDEENLSNFATELNGGPLVGIIRQHVDLLSDSISLFDDLTLIEIDLRGKPS